MTPREVIARLADATVWQELKKLARLGIFEVRGPAIAPATGPTRGQMDKHK